MAEIIEANDHRESGWRGIANRLVNTVTGRGNEEEALKPHPYADRPGFGQNRTPEEIQQGEQLAAHADAEDATDTVTGTQTGIATTQLTQEELKTPPQNLKIN